MWQLDRPVVFYHYKLLLSYQVNHCIYDVFLSLVWTKKYPICEMTSICKTFKNWHLHYQSQSQNFKIVYHQLFTKPHVTAFPAKLVDLTQRWNKTSTKQSYWRLLTSGAAQIEIMLEVCVMNCLQCSILHSYFRSFLNKYAGDWESPQRRYTLLALKTNLPLLLHICVGELGHH